MSLQNSRDTSKPFYPGKHLREVFHRKVTLGIAEKQSLMRFAIRKRPDQAFVAGGLNETVLSPKAKKPIPPKGAHRLEVARKPPTPLRCRSLKVYWRLKTAERRQKQRLFLRLCWIEESFLQAYADILEVHGGRQAIQRLQRQYQQAVAETNVLVSSVSDDQSQYYRDRSEAWLQSREGQAYRDWMEMWKIVLPPSDLPAKTGFEVQMNVSKWLLELPDEPVLPSRSD
jgi:hypothetical protein